jgi:hypothetical protein
LQKNLAHHTKVQGGTPQQREATANLWQALLQHRLVDLVRQLKREDIEASMHHTSLGYEVRIGTSYVEVYRFSHDLEHVKIKVHGFDVSLEHDSFMVTPGALTLDETIANVDKFAANFAKVIAMWSAPC